MYITPHKYPFAINDDGKPVYIGEITQENRRHTHYHCYGCGAELYPVLCTKKQSHFRHEADAICDPDKYLHEYAKAEIKRRFDESETFIVQYDAWRECRKAYECEIYSKCKLGRCEEHGMYQVDLKQFYDTCTAEKGYYKDIIGGRKKYIADLILTNSQNPELPPTCIEVWVTHECTEEKKRYGGHIIEIKIQSEADAKRPIIESDNIDKPIHFYNFRRYIQKEPVYTFKHFKIKDGEITTETSTCSDGIQYDENARRELILSDATILQKDQVLLYSIYLNQTGKEARNPYICSRGKIVKMSHGKEGLRCSFYRNQEGCPCNYFSYSKSKGDEILKRQFRFIPYWHQGIETETLLDLKERLSLNIDPKELKISPIK